MNISRANVAGIATALILTVFAIVSIIAYTQIDNDEPVPTRLVNSVVLNSPCFIPSDKTLSSVIDEPPLLCPDRIPLTEKRFPVLPVSSASISGGAGSVYVGPLDMDGRNTRLTYRLNVNTLTLTWDDLKDHVKYDNLACLNGVCPLKTEYWTGDQWVSGPNMATTLIAPLFDHRQLGPGRLYPSNMDSDVTAVFSGGFEWANYRNSVPMNNVHSTYSGRMTLMPKVQCESLLPGFNNSLVSLLEVVYDAPCNVRPCDPGGYTSPKFNHGFHFRLTNAGGIDYTPRRLVLASVPEFISVVKPECVQVGTQGIPVLGEVTMFTPSLTGNVTACFRKPTTCTDVNLMPCALCAVPTDGVFPQCSNGAACSGTCRVSGPRPLSLQLTQTNGTWFDLHHSEVTSFECLNGTLTTPETIIVNDRNFMARFSQVNVSRQSEVGTKTCHGEFRLVKGVTHVVGECPSASQYKLTHLTGVYTFSQQGVINEPVPSVILKNGGVLKLTSHTPTSHTVLAVVDEQPWSCEMLHSLDWGIGCEEEGPAWGSVLLKVVTVTIIITCFMAAFTIVLATRFADSVIACPGASFRCCRGCFRMVRKKVPKLPSDTDSDEEGEARPLVPRRGRGPRANSGMITVLAVVCLIGGVDACSYPSSESGEVTYLNTATGEAVLLNLEVNTNRDTTSCYAIGEGLLEVTTSTVWIRENIPLYTSVPTVLRAYGLDASDSLPKGSEWPGSGTCGAVRKRLVMSAKCADGVEGFISWVNGEGVFAPAPFYSYAQPVLNGKNDITGRHRMVVHQPIELGIMPNVTATKWSGVSEGGAQIFRGSTFTPRPQWAKECQGTFAEFPLGRRLPVSEEVHSVTHRLSWRPTVRFSWSCTNGLSCEAGSSTVNGDGVRISLPFGSILIQQFIPPNPPPITHATSKVRGMSTDSDDESPPGVAMFQKTKVAAFGTPIKQQPWDETFVLHLNKFEKLTKSEYLARTMNFSVRGDWYSPEVPSSVFDYSILWGPEAYGQILSIQGQPKYVEDQRTWSSGVYGDNQMSFSTDAKRWDQTRVADTCVALNADVGVGYGEVIGVGGTAIWDRRARDLPNRHDKEHPFFDGRGAPLSWTGVMNNVYLARQDTSTIIGPWEFRAGFKGSAEEVIPRDRSGQVSMVWRLETNSSLKLQAAGSRAVLSMTKDPILTGTTANPVVSFSARSLSGSGTVTFTVTGAEWEGSLTTELTPDSKELSIDLSFAGDGDQNLAVGFSGSLTMSVYTGETDANGALVANEFIVTGVLLGVVDDYISENSTTITLTNPSSSGRSDWLDDVASFFSDVGDVAGDIFSLGGTILESLFDFTLGGWWDTIVNILFIVLVIWLGLKLLPSLIACCKTAKKTE
jgi:hypothetical protein